MYLTIKKDFENFRLTFTSNEMSSTFYIEQLPKTYTNNERVRVFSLYFYFHGNKNLNVRQLVDHILENGNSYSYESVKQMMKDFSQKSNDPSDYSLSEKDTTAFNVSPPKDFFQSIKGLDFKGRVYWDKFIFLATGNRLLVSSDAESAQKLFATQTSNQSFLSGRSYDNLINLLKERGYHFEEIYG